MRSLASVSINYVETIDEVLDFKRWLSESRQVLSFDTECTGLRWWRPQFRGRLAQFGDVDTCWTFRFDRWGAVIEEVLRDYEGPMSGSNILGYDAHVLRALGFSLPKPKQLHDTLILSKIAEAWQFDHRLKGWAKREYGDIGTFGEDMLHEAFLKHGLRPDGNDEESERAWSEIPYEDEAYKLYAGLDTVLDARRFAKLYPVVQDNPGFAKAYKREMAAWWVTFEAEHKGLRVDVHKAEEVYEYLTKQINIVRNQLTELGLPEPRKRQKLVKRLIEDGWEPKDFSQKTGQPSTKKAIIEGLDFEVIEPLMEYNRLEHWKAAYVGSVLRTEHNGRVYPSISPMQAKTGREAARVPPIHQIPAKHPNSWMVKQIFLPNEGEKMCSIDSAGQEKRTLAHMSQDPLLLKIFEEGLDIHAYTAAAIFDTKPELITKQQRDIAKTYSYASAYGAKDPKLASTLNVSVGEIAVIRQRVAGAFTGVAAYEERLIHEAEEMFAREGSAYLETLGGRRVYLGTWGTGSGRKLATTQIVNAPQQGTGADFIKEFKNRLAAAGLTDILMFTLHDEGLLSVPEGEEGEEMVNEAVRCMAYKKGDTVFGEPLRLDFPAERGALTDVWSGH